VISYGVMLNFYHKQFTQKVSDSSCPFLSINSTFLTLPIFLPLAKLDYA